MPYKGTISVLTFNLINSLAKEQTRSTALFWLTVWLTAKGQGPWTTDRGYWSRLSVGFVYRSGGGGLIKWVSAAAHELAGAAITR